MVTTYSKLLTDTVADTGTLNIKVSTVRVDHLDNLVLVPPRLDVMLQQTST